MIWPKNYRKRSQDFAPAFHDSGQFYWVKVNNFLKKKKFFTDNSLAFEISATEAQDIDTEDDWKTAELKYKILNKNKRINQ